MPQLTTDQTLLFGLLALQLDFIDRDHLVAALHAWVDEKTRSLTDILHEQGVLTAGSARLLELVVEEHVRTHGSDARRSLTALSSRGGVPEGLLAIDDPDLQASLENLRAGATATDHSPTPAYRRPPAAYPTDLPQGPRFHVLRSHARGGLGEVFVAYDQEVEREVAFKAIQDQFSGSPEYRNRFLLEAKITGGLEHPGIVPVYGLGTDADGRPYYAMRFIRGDSLKRAIELYHRDKEALPAGERILRLRQLLGRFVAVCNAVAYAHSRGVVHRDLKPANILLGKFGETIVVDWGLAKRLGQDETASGTCDVLQLSAGIGATQAGTAVGTPGYMSPEQTAGRPQQLGPASDIYSLGATLYCVLTGRPPLVGLDPSELLRRAEAGDFPRPRALCPDVPRPLEAICRKALACQPEARYGSALEMAEEIEHWLADEPVRADREPWTARLARWARRHRTLVAGAVAAAGVALVALGVATVLLSAANRQVRTAKREVDDQAANLLRANARERRAKAEAEKDRDEASRQKAAADQNFELARGAVRRYLAMVGKDVRLKRAGLHQLRKQLFDEAGTFYEELIRARGDDPAMRVVIAETHLDNAQLASWHRDADRTIERAGKALALLRRLPARERAQAGVQLLLSEVHDALGRGYEFKGNFFAAEREALACKTIRDQLAADRPGEPRYVEARALAWFQLGAIYLSNTKVEQAERTFEQARGLFRKAITGTRKADLDAALAACLVNLGIAHLKSGRMGPSEKALVEARDLFRQVEVVAPNDPRPKDGLGRSLLNLGRVYTNSKRYKEAEAAHAEAWRIYEALVINDPEMPRWREYLVHALGDLAAVYEATGRKALAIAKRRLACAAGDRLVAAAPAEASYAVQLAHDNLALGRLLLRDRKALDAVTPYTRAIELMEAEVKKSQPRGSNPARSREFLRTAYSSRATAGQAAGKYAEAVADWDRALQLDDGSSELLLRAGRALSLARLRDHVRAAADADAVTRSEGTPSGIVHVAAAAYALCVGVVKDDPVLRERYASRAVYLLRLAHEAGHFRDPGRRARLKKDPDFDSLRQRADFRLLLAEITSQPDSPPIDPRRSQPGDPDNEPD
jgi:serine/threonine-protein kinase